MKEDLSGWGLIVILFGLFLALVLGTYVWNSYQCGIYGESVELKSKFNITGCYLNYEGKWMELDALKYRVIEGIKSE